MPMRRNASAGPIPESINSCGLLIAPAHTITSRSARIVMRWPARKASTPVARPRVCTILKTSVRSDTRKFARPASRLRKARAALARRP
jgi:hypothetical protein